MKADDARKMTEDSIAQKKAEQEHIKRKLHEELELARKKARDRFDEHYEEVMNCVRQDAGQGRRDTKVSFVAYLDKDGYHGARHAHEVELAKLSERRLRSDGYTVKRDLKTLNEGQEDQAVCIDLLISW
jgi:hypothetical protein